MTKTIVLQLALVALLAGCAVPVTVPDATRLTADEGIIVYSVKCGPGVAWAQFFPSGESSRGYRAESRRAGILSCGDEVQTQRLQAGRYFVGKVGYRGVVDFTEATAMQFQVAAGKLNYIGHITLPSSDDIGAVLISDPFVSERQGEAVTWLAANHASLHGEYEIVTALAQSPSRLATNGREQGGAAADATQFTVILKLRVAADGSVREGHIAESSGNISVDDTALAEAVRNWQITPATEGGAPVQKWGNYSVTYRRAN